MLVTPAKSLVTMGKKPLKLVIVNRQRTDFDHRSSLRVFGDCDDLWERTLPHLLAHAKLLEWELGRGGRMKEYGAARDGDVKKSGLPCVTMPAGMAIQTSEAVQAALAGGGASSRGGRGGSRKAQKVTHSAVPARELRGKLPQLVQEPDAGADAEPDVLTGGVLHMGGGAMDEDDGF